MPTHPKIARLIRLQERAESCLEEYKRLIEIEGQKSKAHRKLKMAERIQAEITGLIKDFVWFEPG